MSLIGDLSRLVQSSQDGWRLGDPLPFGEAGDTARLDSVLLAYNLTRRPSISDMDARCAIQFMIEESKRLGGATAGCTSVASQLQLDRIFAQSSEG